MRRPPGHLAQNPPGPPGAQGHLARLAQSPPGVLVAPTWQKAHLAATWRRPHLAHLAQEYVPFASDPRYQGVLEASDDEGRTVIMHARSLCTSSCVAPPGTLHMNENAARRGARTKIVQGWPKLWANFRPLIGIFSQSVGPSLTIWANPVQFSFRMPPSSRPPRRRTGSARPGAGGRRAPAGPAARATRRPTRRRWRRRCYSWTRSLSYYAPVLLFIWKFFMGGCMREHIQ